MSIKKTVSTTIRNLKNRYYRKKRDNTREKRQKQKKDKKQKKQKKTRIIKITKPAFINRKTEKNKKSIKITKLENKKDNDIIIKSVTPVNDMEEGKNIFNQLKKPKLKKIDEEMDVESYPLSSMRSFSPKINKDLVSLKSFLPQNVLKCKDLLETNIGDRCLPYTSKEVKNKLLKNLRASKYLDCSRFIAPKQYNSNCWFNTMFVTFFFSDKGRKFFRFMRQLMITGEKNNGEKIPDELAKVFFIFNKVIEASYNQDSNSNIELIRNYNTNYFIENIYRILLQKNIVTYKKDESGNPIEYYSAIINYLNYNAINILNIDITSNNDFKNISRFIPSNDIPEIILVEIIDRDAVNITNRPSTFNIVKFGKKHTYKLDAAIVRDISQQHFCSVLTCNDNGYSFDGASFSRLSPYNWRDSLNREIKWGFEGHTLKWSFMKGYQMLFYYKI